MIARILGKEKPARDGNPCGPGATFETCEEIMEHQTGYGKPKDNADYVAFLQEKTPIASFDGFDIEDCDIHPILKPHQRHGARREQGLGRHHRRHPPEIHVRIVQRLQHPHRHFHRSGKTQLALLQFLRNCVQKSLLRQIQCLVCHSSPLALHHPSPFIPHYPRHRRHPARNSAK